MNNSNYTHAPATINDLQLIIENALEGLRPAPLSENITAAFPYLLPKGLRLRVQLEEGGRKKRNTAAASNWNPQTGEIVIYYEPADSELEPPAPAQPAVSSKPPIEAAPIGASQTAHPAPATVSPVMSSVSEDVTPLQIQQCCDALAHAEKAGKLFIAFKWFRDEELPKYNYDWTKSPDRRQRVIAHAIDTDAIQTQKIPNPKSLQHPTTTVKLNRAKAPATISKRFNPIVVRGEPVSVTIMRDRGSF